MKQAIRPVNKDYLKSMGIDVARMDQRFFERISNGSQEAARIYASFGGRLPLLSQGGSLGHEFVSIPADLELRPHRNTGSCPPRIVEVTPVKSGCQVNCQYCLTFTQNGMQERVQIYRDYPEWLRGKLRENAGAEGTMYYFSAKTEAFSRQMLELGITQAVLHQFGEHVREMENANGECRDTLMIITKAGEEDLFVKSRYGTPMELLSGIPDHVQVSSSITYFPDEKIRETMEPGATLKAERLALVMRLRTEGILAWGMLVQPIFHVFQPSASFWSELASAGIRRASIDIFTTTMENLAVVAQIIGWHDKSAEMRMWADYIFSDAPSKDGIRRGISVEKQRTAYEEIVRAANEAGIGKVTYCRYVQKMTDLPVLNYCEDGMGGCMANISPPTPQTIRAARIS